MATHDRTVLLALGLAVRALRLRLGWSQEDFAVRADLHRTYIGGIERGERNVGVTTVFVLASALGVSAAELVGETERLLPELAQNLGGSA